MDQRLLDTHSMNQHRRTCFSGSLPKKGAFSLISFDKIERNAGADGKN